MSDYLMPTATLDPDYCRVVMARWADRLPEPDANGCILWPGNTEKGGYGRITMHDKPRKAHRVAYVAATGQDIPAGLVIDHLCRNRLCITVSHLRVVTNKTNVLAGQGFAADHAQRTHCKQGHPLEGDNLRDNQLRRGRRDCRTCQTERCRKNAAAQRAAAKHLGLTVVEYLAQYGYSRTKAEQILTLCPTHAAWITT